MRAFRARYSSKISSETKAPNELLARELTQEAIDRGNGSLQIME
jgi:hypothetical protein